MADQCIHINMYMLYHFLLNFHMFFGGVFLIK
jgi:hypothetical protein